MFNKFLKQNNINLNNINLNSNKLNLIKIEQNSDEKKKYLQNKLKNIYNYIIPNKLINIYKLDIIINIYTFLNYLYKYKIIKNFNKNITNDNHILQLKIAINLLNIIGININNNDISLNKNNITKNQFINKINCNNFIKLNNNDISNLFNITINNLNFNNINDFINIFNFILLNTFGIYIEQNDNIIFIEFLNLFIIKNNKICINNNINLDDFIIKFNKINKPFFNNFIDIPLNKINNDQTKKIISKHIDENNDFQLIYNNYKLVENLNSDNFDSNTDDDDIEIINMNNFDKNICNKLQKKKKNSFNKLYNFIYNLI